MLDFGCLRGDLRMLVLRLLASDSYSTLTGDARPISSVTSCSRWCGSSSSAFLASMSRISSGVKTMRPTSWVMKSSTPKLLSTSMVPVGSRTMNTDLVECVECLSMSLSAEKFSSMCSSISGMCTTSEILRFSGYLISEASPSAAVFSLSSSR